MKEMMFFSIFSVLVLGTGLTVIKCSSDNKTTIDSTAIYKQQLAEKDSIIMFYQDSLFKARHSLAAFDDRFKLAKIKRYVTICDRTPSNKKFFFGWIKRTITQ